MPKVSVIIPVYNTEKYLKECLDSVINQTLTDIEIICIDDGSFDNSLAILQEYAQKDTRIRILKQKNKGAGAARNMGLNIATGKYLAFLDSDDFFYKDFCKKMYNKAKETDADIVVCKAMEFNNLTKKPSKMTWSLVEEQLPNKNVFSYKDFPKFIFGFSQNWVWNKIFKKTFIKQKNISFLKLFRTNDLYFTCVASVLAERITCIKEELVNYRVGLKTNSQSTNFLYPLDFYTSLKKLKHFLKKRKIYKEVEQSYINWALGACIYNIETQYDEALKAKLIKTIFPKLLWEIDLIKVNKVDIYKNYDLEQYNYYYEKWLYEYSIISKAKPFIKIYNDSRNMHKIITIFGIKLKLRRKI